MKRLMWTALAAAAIVTAVRAQSNPDYPMYHKYVTQDKSFTACPSGTASIFATLNTGKPMFIMVTGSACGNCSATASSVRTYASQVAGRVNMWIAWNAFGDNSCSTIQNKINEGYPGYTLATHIRDSQYYFGNTYVGEFNLPVFIVIDGTTRYVTCMASQDHDGGLNALRIASAACNALLSTGVTAGELRVVPHAVSAAQEEGTVVVRGVSPGAHVRLFDMCGRVIHGCEMGGAVRFGGLASSRYTAIVSHNGRETALPLTVAQQR